MNLSNAKVTGGISRNPNFARTNDPDQIRTAVMAISMAFRLRPERVINIS